MFTALNASLQKHVDDVDDDKDYFYLFLGNVNGCIDENNGTKYLIFSPA